jgi:hypothetical protein
MADNPHKKKSDGKLVSNQPWERNYLANKTNMPKPLVEKIIKSNGPSRKAVEQKLNEMKKNGSK